MQILLLWSNCMASLELKFLHFILLLEVMLEESSIPVLE